MKTHNIEAIVLKNINYKDTHRLYTLLTLEKGKISAVARGVRKISSRRAGSLDTLNNVSLGLNEDKTGFYSITEAKVLNSFSALKNSLDFIFTGLYFAELVDLFLESDHQNVEVFNLVKSGLTVLSKNPSNPEIVVNVFEFRLLDKLGYGLTINSCVVCGKSINDNSENIKLNLELGGTVCGEHDFGGVNLHPQSIKLFNLIKVEKNLKNVLDFDKKYVKQVDKLIKEHLKQIVEVNGRYHRVNHFLRDSVSI